jgi:hypothetical protein
MATEDRKLVDAHAAFLVGPGGVASEAMVLTERQAMELHENLGRKLNR